MYKTFQFDFKELNLNVIQIVNVMGYQEGESHDIVTELISEILNESEDMCNIKAEFRIFNEITFNDFAKSVKINDFVFEVKKIVFNQLKKSDTIAIFFCTAGKEIGIRSRNSMKEGDLLKGYVYDVVGSEIVEAAGDLMQNELEKYMLVTGKKITNGFSPGYCGWDVAEQHKLIQLLPDNYCGIRLTDSALMDPVKSVSGFIGIGENVERLPYTCSFCDMKDCLYRKNKA